MYSNIGGSLRENSWTAWACGRRPVNFYLVVLDIRSAVRSTWKYTSNKQYRHQFPDAVTTDSFFSSCGAATQRGSWPPHSWGFLDHTRRTTVGRTPLDEWSARRTDLWQHTTLTTDNISLPPVGFEPTISAGDRPQTYALDRTATGTGTDRCCTQKNLIFPFLVRDNARLQKSDPSPK